MSAKKPVKNNNIVNRLSEVLKEHKIQQKIIAKKISVTPQYISKMVNGKVPLTYRFLECLATNYNISIDHIITGVRDERISGKPFKERGKSENTDNSVCAVGRTKEKEKDDLDAILDDNNLNCVEDNQIEEYVATLKYDEIDECIAVAKRKEEEYDKKLLIIKIKRRKLEAAKRKRGRI